MEVKRNKFLKEYLTMLVEMLIFIYFINTFLVQVFAIPSSSMENNMLIGDHLLVNKVRYAGLNCWPDKMFMAQQRVERGDIVTFKAPPEIKAGNYERIWYVKRVIGLPTETIRVENREVFINGRKLDENYTCYQYNQVSFGDFPNLGDEFPPQEFPREFLSNFQKTPGGYQFKIPENHYFCMGDNRDRSSDSRIWGPVPADNIVGSPWRVLWSVKQNKSKKSGNAILEKIRNLVLLIPDFLFNTRWKRTLQKYH
jgi:signal peptidase I